MEIKTKYRIGQMAMGKIGKNTERRGKITEIMVTVNNNGISVKYYFGGGCFDEKDVKLID